MKSFALLSVLAAGLLTPAFAQNAFSTLPNENEFTLEDLVAHSRISVGVSREGVLNQLRNPNAILNADVWVYTDFLAANVSTAGRADTLVLTFKNDKVDTIRLVTKEQVRAAAAAIARASASANTRAKATPSVTKG